MIVGWTGHRPDLFDDPIAARAAVDDTARELAAQAAPRFLVGGQRRVDTWAALAAVQLAVPFTIILPLPVQEFTVDWEPVDRQVLERTLSGADEVRVAAGYTDRNRIVATQAELLVVVWAGVLGGGTAETVALARAAGTPLREVVLEPSGSARAAHGRGV